MSAILSVDDLNDFISPGVACIKPVETLPKQRPEESANPYEVTTDDKVSAATAPPAQISLTDCLACSGCVTSAEAVLVSLQSHGEVLDTLDRYTELRQPWMYGGIDEGMEDDGAEGRIFVASISPQSRASLAATYNITEREAGHMVCQLLSGPEGLRKGGKNGSGFTWVINTDITREACLVAAADEVQQVIDAPSGDVKKPILTSACPGWICYAEKTHPHVLPHLSKMKSPQALTGTLIKSVLAKKFGVPPHKVWHLAVMPCFDKKLEASRTELTSHTWHGQDGDAVRDVDCVITARELLMLAESRDISFPQMAREPLSESLAIPFPDSTLDNFLFGGHQILKRKRGSEDRAAIGTSGGYLHHVLKTQQARYCGSEIKMQRGRNTDVAEFSVVTAEGQPVFKAARYYGFRNIQNLVRKMKPVKVSRVPGAVRRPGGARKPGSSVGGDDIDNSYVEVMACPGGCTNGGGQIKVGDVATLRQVGGTGIENGTFEQEVLPAQREWLARVDEAYWSAESSDEEQSVKDADGDVAMQPSVAETADRDIVDGIDRTYIQGILQHWSRITDVGLDKLLYTTYRAVESDVGKEKKEKGSEMERVSALAVAQGGGW